MQVWYMETKRCHEREQYGSKDTVRIDLCTHPPRYDYAVGYIEASIVMGEDKDMQDKLKAFLDEAAKLYTKMILDGKVKEL